MAQRWICPWCGIRLLMAVDHCPCGYDRQGDEEIVDDGEKTPPHPMLRKILPDDVLKKLDE